MVCPSAGVWRVQVVVLVFPFQNFAVEFDNPWTSVVFGVFEVVHESEYVVWFFKVSFVGPEDYYQY